MPETLEVERADLTAVQTVKEILDRAATIPARQGIEQWPISFDEDEVTRNIENGGVYLFRRDGRIVGTVDYRNEDDLIWGHTRERAAYIHRLAIYPTFSGLGIGNAIVAWAKNKAEIEGDALLRLDCVTANQKLRTYYEKLGFLFVRDVVWGGGRTSLYEVELSDHRLN